MLPSSTVFSMDEDIIGTISCPPILRLFIFGMITGIWRGFLFIFIYLFIYLFVIVALGVPLPILISPWWRGTHRGHVSYSDRLKGLVSGETFQLSCAFRDKPF